MAKITDIRAREIIVNVGHGEDGRDQPTAKRRKGTPQTSRADDGILHRRKREGGINFYDLGFKKGGDGIFRTVFFRQVPDWIFGGSSATIRNLLPLDYTTRDSAVFSGVGAVSTWKDTFKKITKGPLSLRSRIRIQAGAGAIDGFLDDLPSDVWTDKGLILTQGELNDPVASIDTDENVAFFDGFLFNADPNFKITRLPFFAAPGVTFSPVPKMDVFLMPQMHINSGNSFAVISIVPPGVQRTVRVQANYFYTIKPREPILIDSDPWFGHSLSGWFSPSVFTGLTPAQNYSAAWDAKNYLNANPHRAIGYDDYLHTWANSSFPVGPFPAPPAFPPNTSSLKGESLEAFFSPITPGAYGFKQILLAAILKGNDPVPFYIWAQDAP